MIQLILTTLLCLTIHLFSTPEKRLHICTVASHQHQALDILRKSVLDQGLALEVSGMNEFYPNHFYKIYRMRAYLETLPKQDIVLFIDARNSFLLGNEEEILHRYESFKKPCVFSAEKRLSPKNPLQGLNIRYPLGNTSFQFLNSGGYIANVTFVKMMLEEMIANRYTIPLSRYRQLKSDQMACHRFFAQNQAMVEIDRQNKMFLTLTDVEEHELDIDLNTKSITVKETGNTPLVIHGNGQGKSLYQKLVQYYFN